MITPRLDPLNGNQSHEERTTDSEALRTTEGGEESSDL